MKAFHFSLDLQVHVEEHKLEDTDVFDGFVLDSYALETGDKTESPSKSAAGRHAFIMFLRRAAFETGEKMTDCNDLHLPFFKKPQVYDVFEEDFKNVHVGDPTETYDSFSYIWKNNCSEVKVRKSTHLTKRTKTEFLRFALREAVLNSLPTKAVREEKKNGALIHEQRQGYSLKVDLAKRRPNKFLSRSIDDADQSEYTLTLFTAKVKDVRGHGIGVHLLGLLNHGQLNRPLILAMTKEHQTGANHIIEVMHLFLSDFSNSTPLLNMFLIQMDNCSREINNHFVMAYLAYLVINAVFDEIEVRFCPWATLT